METNKLIKLALDTYRGNVSNYSTQDANEVLRSALGKIAGAVDGKIDYKTFRKNKYDIFEILEEMMVEVVNEGLVGQFDDMVDYRNLAWGDTNLFVKPTEQEFKVALISDGNGNMRRQQLRDGEEFSVGLYTYGVKIYEEFYRFIAGRIDWAEMVNLVAKAFRDYIEAEIFNAVYKGFEDVTGVYKYQGAYDENELIDVASHVEAGTGEGVVIFGTKKALSKVAPSSISDRMRDEKNRLGYYGTVAGYELRAIPQNHKKGTDEFQLRDDMLLVLPLAKDKFVKVVNEGTALIEEHKAERTDKELEYEYTMKFGISVMPSKKFGTIILQ